MRKFVFDLSAELYTEDGGHVVEIIRKVMLCQRSHRKIQPVKLPKAYRLVLSTYPSR
jgi:hypothetical protein